MQGKEKGMRVSMPFDFANRVDCTTSMRRKN